MNDRELDALGPCEPWSKGRNAKGYGVANRKIAGRWKHILAHRLAWEMANGPIPVGKEVCHHCDNPPCVRLDHLFIGTHRENMQDSARKGRNGTHTHPESNPLRAGRPVRRVRGDEHGMAILADTDIPMVRGLLLEGRSKSVIARLYGVSRSTVSMIARGRTWRHVG